MLTAHANNVKVIATEIAIVQMVSDASSVILLRSMCLVATEEGMRTYTRMTSAIVQTKIVWAFHMDPQNSLRMEYRV